MPAGAEGLLFLPYLTGERLAEHTNSRAQFFGLQRKHRRGHLFRAVLEGVAFASWRNLRQLQKCGQYPQQMIASGGARAARCGLKSKPRRTICRYYLRVIRRMASPDAVLSPGLA